MTSSLVGSEMCIRDRRRFLGSWRRVMGTLSGATPIGASPRAAPPHPVSYTHLTLPTICSV
eukprot:4141976-Prorocentrum_lima.AAC.1